MLDATILRAEDLENGLNALSHSDFDVLVLSFPNRALDAEQALSHFKSADPLLPVIVYHASGDVEDVVALTKLGAFHCFVGEIDTLRLEAVVEAAREWHTAALCAEGEAVAGESWRAGLVGDSAAMNRLVQTIRLVAPRKSTVLVAGETGTGKEVVARAIHSAGNRSDRPFVAVNCSAIPEALVESELFGHVRGAYTGAHVSRPGVFEQAHTGTLFLDEIGDLPLDAQGKLLRVLQERELRRVGGTEVVRVDVRLIAATNVDLADAVRRKAFREDLYYRLNVVPIRLPSLRERASDISKLVDYFACKICRAEGLPLKHASPEAMEALKSHDWPGNIRQLQHAVEMAVVMSGDRQTLYASDFGVAGTIVKPEPVFALPETGLDLETTLARIERGMIEQALFRTGGNKSRAAELLRMKRTTLLERVNRHNAERKAVPEEMCAVA